MRTITVEETAKLYAFTRAHYVEYYDVQTELVDHLASAMEKNWAQEPELGFEDNLQREFKKFGIYGFSRVVEKKASAMEKRYLKIIFKECLRFLAKPKVALLLLLFNLLSVWLMRAENGFYYLSGGYLLIFTGFLLLFLWRTHQSKKQRKAGEKIFMLEATIRSSGAFASGFWLPIQFLSYAIDAGELSALLPRIGISVLLSLLLLLSYILYFQLPKRKNELIKEHCLEVRFLNQV